MSNDISATDLGLDLTQPSETDLFKWFLAAYLFGKPIQQQVARRTWQVFVDHDVTSPAHILDRTWQQVVDLLVEGRYRRYDESTATNLHKMARQLTDDYGGKINNMKNQSTDKQDFSKRLQTLQGVGPKTAEIFLREVKTG